MPRLLTKTAFAALLMALAACQTPAPTPVKIYSQKDGTDVTGNYGYFYNMTTGSTPPASGMPEPDMRIGNTKYKGEWKKQVKMPATPASCMPPADTSVTHYTATYLGEAEDGSRISCAYNGNYCAYGFKAVCQDDKGEKYDAIMWPPEWMERKENSPF